MTQNPFEALTGGAGSDDTGGGGGFDMSALLQQAQQMQEQLQAAQEQLAETSVEGTVAGGAVTVTVSGTGELSGVTITSGQFDGNDADDLTDLGDLIIAAYRDAKSQADALASEALGPLAGAGGALGGDAGEGPGASGAGQLGF